ncbi:MAG: hypothetical protein QOD99_383 [Chthoniobacter sp.]|jgi:hypothetical protein|nr:hypothetical protein [Chthoniobacter sp.]
MRISSLVFATLLGLTACGKRITNANIDAVNGAFDRAENAPRAEGVDHGVSPKEVESMLGVPTRVESFKMEIQTRKPVVEGTRYIYEQDGQAVVLHFVDNKLISKSPYFGEKSPDSPEEKK